VHRSRPFGLILALTYNVCNAYSVENLQERHAAIGPVWVAPVELGWVEFVAMNTALHSYQGSCLVFPTKAYSTSNVTQEYFVLMSLPADVVKTGSLSSHSDGLESSSPSHASEQLQIQESFFASLGLEHVAARRSSLGKHRCKKHFKMFFYKSLKNMFSMFLKYFLMFLFIFFWLF